MMIFPQSTIDIWNSTTLNKFYIEKNAHIPQADIPPLINNRSLECHYTKYVLHIIECTYTQERCAPLQSTIDLWNSTTQNKFYI